MGGCILLPGCVGGCGGGAEFLLADAAPRVGLSLVGGEGASGVGADAVGGGVPPVGAAAGGGGGGGGREHGRWRLLGRYPSGGRGGSGAGVGNGRSGAVSLAGLALLT